MKLEVWSDYICPYCYKGKRTMDLALKEFEHRDEVEIIYRSYVLSPDANHEKPELVNDMLVKKYNMHFEDIQAENLRLTKQAAKLGLEYKDLNSRFDVNTFDAHRIGKYAFLFGKEGLWTERLMKASFTEGLFIGNHETLVMLAKEIGLDTHEVKKILKSNLYKADVLKDIELADQLDVETVPFFAIDREYAISGVITIDDFINALNTAYIDSIKQK
jgi:predicted DsbA family dithiol-disulfide isomerase